MTTNPFKPAEQVVPKVKCLIYGQSGVGKTYLALTAPGKVAVIDTEGGTAFYAGRSGLSEFDVLPTKTFNDVTRAIRYLAENPGEYETLVIDPVTVLYETLQDAAQVKRVQINERKGRRDPDADLEMLDWQRIKRAYKTLMTDLVNLPMHVIVTARERDETERRGNEQIKIGTRPDAEKGTAYFFDIVLRLTADGDKRSAFVSKDRTGTLPVEVDKPSFDRLFGKALKAGKNATTQRTVAADDEAAAEDAATTFADNANQSLPPGPDGSLVGKVAVQGTQDFMLRQSPDGYTLPFRVVSGRAGVIVLARNELAMALSQLHDVVIGQRVTIWGRLEEQTTNKPDGTSVQWQAFILSRIQTPDGVLPADEPAPAPVDDAPVEAPSVPLFDDSDMAALDAEQGAA